MPKIPISIDNLPTEFEPLDESLAYHVVVRACKLADEADKNGNNYLTGVKLEVLEPEEWRGRNIYDNYICIPAGAGPGSSLAERRKSEEFGIRLARFIKAFKVPYDVEGIDPDDAVGCEGDVSMVNDDYQGRKMPKVSDYLM